MIVMGLPSALISGGARGIGRGIAQGLAEQGYRVFITARDLDTAERAAEELSQGVSGSVEGLAMEVTDQQSVDSVIAAISADPEGLDVLVNNAGVIGHHGEAAGDISLEEAHEIVEINVFGAWRLTQAALPLLRKSAHPRIVNLSSGLGQLHDMGENMAAYRVSKAGLNALTRVFANEERKNDVLVNTMCPGWVRTDLGGPQARRSVEEGADTAIWLATLPDDGPTGGFFRDREPIPW
jgi:NAD(P)-dependent dehydrogenase (short-subunit alcohol dehydrogenase family)